MAKKEFFLDFSNCKNLNEVYHVINNKIGFAKFGFNLDALVDILRGGFDHFDEDDDVVLRITPIRDRVEEWETIIEIMKEADNITVVFESENESGSIRTT